MLRLQPACATNCSGRGMSTIEETVWVDEKVVAKSATLSKDGVATRSLFLGVGGVADAGDVTSATSAASVQTVARVQTVAGAARVQTVGCRR